LLSISGQLNQTFNLSKYNQDPKWKRNQQTKVYHYNGTLLLLGITYGTYKYIHPLSHEGTDAQIEKHESYYPRVSGYVSKVYIKDNDFVKKGDTLFTIDNDYELKIDEAEATLAAAR
jgi:membrane fusion protein (multidrug efflux system)